MKQRKGMLPLLLISVSGAVIVFFALRALLVELFTAWNREQLSTRPELENWTTPGYGTGPAATAWAWSICAVALSIVVALIVVRQQRLRAEHQIRCSED